MAITDEDLILLEQLTYIDNDVCKAAGVSSSGITGSESVADMLERFDVTALANLEENQYGVLNDEGGSTYISGAEWAAVIREIQSRPDLMSLKIYDVTTDKSSGHTKIDTMVFYQPTGNNEDLPDDAIVCFRGTLGAQEWKDNFQLLITGDTPINQQVLKYVDDLPFDNLTTVGHSKGGNKAAYTYYLSDKVCYCVAMDAPGMPLSFYDEHPEAREKAMREGGIHSYAVAGDFVNILMYPLFGAYTQYVVGHGQNGYLENHSPNTFFLFITEPYNTHLFVDENGSILEFTDQSEHMAKLHGFTLFAYQFMPYETKVEMTDYLGNAVIIAMGGSVDIDGTTYSKDNLMDYLLSNKEMLSTLLAYFFAYCNEYDMNWSDLKVFMSFGKARFALGKLFKYAKQSFADGEISDKTLDWWHTIIDALEVDVDQEVLDQIWYDALDKYNEVVQMDNMGAPLLDYNIDPNFIPGTSIAAPQQTSVSSTAITSGSVTETFATGAVIGANAGVVPTPTTKAITDPTGVLANMDANTLYLDNKAYEEKRKGIFTASNNLLFDESAFGYEGKVCGTDSMLLLADYWHNVAISTANYKDFKLGVVDDALGKTALYINMTDTDLASQIKPNEIKEDR